MPIGANASAYRMSLAAIAKPDLPLQIDNAPHAVSQDDRMDDQQVFVDPSQSYQGSGEARRRAPAGCS